ncbi:hypothetical protein [Streptomyces erythrochromogenes]|uniref:hypothetical protein n=1 Tax=Streptomyces erythrochromogenes TaxID=285574 RepID=UPI0036B4F035
MAGAPDWQAAMITGHHVLWGSRRLLARAGPDLGPGNGERLSGRADGVAARMRGAAQRAATIPSADGSHGSGAAAVGAAAEPAAGLGGGGGAGGGAAQVPEVVAPSEFFAAQTWLDSLALDVERVLAPYRAPDPAGADSTDGAAPRPPRSA